MPDQDHNPTPPPKIRFNEPGFGAPSESPSMGGPGRSASSGFEVEEDETAPVDPEAVTASKKIRTFGQMTNRGPDELKRRPNKTGQGAIHVRTFHAKLTNEALAFMDQTINEWLDQHPEYEVKFVSVTVGEFTGKVREPALICQVWV